MTPPLRARRLIVLSVPDLPSLSARMYQDVPNCRLGYSRTIVSYCASTLEIDLLTDTSDVVTKYLPIVRMKISFQIGDRAN